MCVYLGNFAIQQKLTEHCKSTITKKILKKPSTWVNIYLFKLVYLFSWDKCPKVKLWSYSSSIFLWPQQSIWKFLGQGSNES